MSIEQRRVLATPIPGPHPTRWPRRAIETMRADHARWRQGMRRDAYGALLDTSIPFTIGQGRLVVQC